MKLRNIAIIAHVDHGKTTLVDELFKQSGNLSRQSADCRTRHGFSNDLERERGITILAKCTSVVWGKIRASISSTRPAMPTFGGEVERILSMVDGVLRSGRRRRRARCHKRNSCVGKALRLGLKPIVVINKVDKPEERAQEVP